MADIVVTLSASQVTKGLEYANKVYPTATNAELLAMLEKAAYEGPGVRKIIGEWELQSLVNDENAAREVAEAEFTVVFPKEYVG